jgi:hypothetical protein
MSVYNRPTAKNQYFENVLLKEELIRIMFYKKRIEFLGKEGESGEMKENTKLIYRCQFS